MHIRLKLFGTLRRLSLKNSPGFWEGEVPEGTTLREALSLLGAGTFEANAAAVNGEPAPLDIILEDGMEITVVTPMGGG